MSYPQPSLFAAPPQTTLPMDDIGGLQLVHARFKRSEPFSWELFAGYDSLRVMTCSASIPAIVRMLSDFSFLLLSWLLKGIRPVCRMTTSF